MPHTFLLRPGRWQARGHLSILGEGSYPFFGYAVLQAIEGRTLENQVVLDAVGAGGPRLETRYRLHLRPGGADVELDDALLRGEVAEVGDLLAVVASDAAGSVILTETLVQVADDEYRVTGVYAEEGRVRTVVRGVLRRHRPGE